MAECNHDCANCASKCASAQQECNHDCENCASKCGSAQQEQSSGCNHDCANCSSKCDKASFITEPHKLSSIKKVIGIVSGKGGVGKSLVTSLMATLTQRMGYQSAILDADITGPSIPKAFGLNERAYGTADGLMPVVSRYGTQVMSLNLLIDDPSDRVVWRGPVIAGAVKQFWTDVIWQDVDFMFIDMPPGTGDVPLTVFQSLKVDGIIVVTSPQELVSMIVEKALKMAKLMNIPVLGIVENMSYVECPDCKKQIKIFGESHIEEIAAQHGVEVLAKMPIDPSIAQAVDNGLVERVQGEYMEKAVKKVVSLLD